MTVSTRAVPNGEHTVIELFRLGRAMVLVVDTVRVELKGAVRRVNCHRYRTVSGNGVGQCAFVALWDVVTSCHVGTDRCALKAALVVLGLVRIGVLRVDAFVLLNVAKRFVLVAAVATLAALCSRAVDEVLLAERHEMAVLQRVLTFDGTCGDVSGVCVTETDSWGGSIFGPKTFWSRL